MCTADIGKKYLSITGNIKMITTPPRMTTPVPYKKKFNKNERRNKGVELDEDPADEEEDVVKYFCKAFLFSKGVEV